MKIEQVKSPLIVVGVTKSQSEKGKEEINFGDVLDSVLASPVKVAHGCDSPTSKDDQSNSSDANISHSAFELAMTQSPLSVTPLTQGVAPTEAVAEHNDSKRKIVFDVGLVEQAAKLSNITSQAIGYSMPTERTVFFTEGEVVLTDTRLSYLREGATGIQAIAPVTTGSGSSGRSSDFATSASIQLTPEMPFATPAQSKILDPSVKSDVLVKTVPLMLGTTSDLPVSGDPVGRAILDETKFAQSKTLAPSVKSDVSVKTVPFLPGTTNDLPVSGDPVGRAILDETKFAQSKTLAPSVKSDVSVKTVPLMSDSTSDLPVSGDPVGRAVFDEVQAIQSKTLDLHAKPSVSVKTAPHAISGISDFQVNDTVVQGLVDGGVVPAPHKIPDSQAKSEISVETAVPAAGRAIDLQTSDWQNSAPIENSTVSTSRIARPFQLITTANLYASGEVFGRSGSFMDNARRSVIGASRGQFPTESSVTADIGAEAAIKFPSPFVEKPLAPASLQALKMEILSFAAHPEQPTLTLEVSPPEYGKVIVSAEKERSGRVIVHLVTETAAAKLALSEHLPKPTVALEVRIYTADEYREWAEQPRQDPGQEDAKEQDRQNNKKRQVEFKV